ncbi:MAG: hypothetical protein CL675_01185 [Bdellovibrionaceae bacterium]|nr:hypothetical protein [Pseudobdellovibrionaceae bacterium]
MGFTRGICAFLICVVSSSALADTAALFNQFYYIERNNSGEAVRIRLKEDKSTEAVTEDVLNDLASGLFALQSQKSSMVSSDFQSELEWDQWTEEDKEAYRLALGGVDQSVLFSNARKDKGFMRVLRQLELNLFRLRYTKDIAHVTDPLYFYEGEVERKIRKELWKLADSIFDEVPILNIVRFVISETMGMYRVRQRFFQHLLLHILEADPQGSMIGLSSVEVDQVRSSIYASRLSYDDILDMDDILDQWQSYGNEEQTEAIQQAEKRFKRYQRRFFTDVSVPYSYAFNEGQRTGRRNRLEVYNLSVKKWRYSGQPSSAYIFRKPDKIFQSRVVLRGLQLALRFVSIPIPLVGSRVRRFFDKTIRSFYAGQREVEGGLFGYFVAHCQLDKAMQVVKQNLNPVLQRYVREQIQPSLCVATE